MAFPECETNWCLDFSDNLGFGVKEERNWDKRQLSIILAQKAFGNRRGSFVSSFVLVPGCYYNGCGK